MRIISGRFPKKQADFENPAIRSAKVARQEDHSVLHDERAMWPMRESLTQIVKSE